MTIEEKMIDHLYVLLGGLVVDEADGLKVDYTGPDTVSALRWAIFTLEQEIRK